MDFERVVELASGFVLEPVDDEFTVYHPTETTTLHLNQTGALLWQMCDGRRTVAEIVDLLAEAYPHQRQEIAAQVADFVEALVERGVARLR